MGGEGGAKVAGSRRSARHCLGTLRHGVLRKLAGELQAELCGGEESRPREPSGTIRVLGCRTAEEVARLAPERVDGPRNMARVALQDGDLERVYGLLEQCERMAPGNPQTAWIWGVAHQKAGRYTDAEDAYRHVLLRFPQDRATWRNLGRVLYLDGRFEEALQALDQVLHIDPEDRSAHYHRMLCLRNLGREDEAAASEQAYTYYQVDESAQEVTRSYRMDHPDANREVQKIHVHAPTPSSTATAPGRGM